MSSYLLRNDGLEHLISEALKQRPSEDLHFQRTTSVSPTGFVCRHQHILSLCLSPPTGPKRLPIVVF